MSDDLIALQSRLHRLVYRHYQDNATHKSAGLFVVDRARTPTLEQFVAMRDTIACG